MITKLLKQLNIFHSCKEFNVPIWSCPRFVFIIMGMVNIASILATYYIGQHYADPEIIVGIVTLLTVFLLVITHVLVSAFEKVLESRRAETAHNKEILELKDQFVYIAVHNIRSSATAIKWGLRVLESQLTHITPGDKEVFSIIRSRTEGLLRLVQNVLLITKIESGKLECPLEPLQLLPLLEEVLKPFGGLPFVHISLPTEELVLQGNAAYTSEVLSLLLENAMTHADHEKPFVQFTTHLKNSWIVITIENNGAGIDPRDHASVFNKFWRATKSGDIERTGFGLYVAKELTTLMGGTLTFQSAKEKTVFTISLPINNAQA
jgi:signal transduction histidine kinase